MKPGEVQDTLERQIRAEKAGALARAVEALEVAVAELARFDACQAGEGPADQRRELLAEAGERLWYVVIQREAMGLRRHEMLYETLRVPADVRGAMGPRRRRR